MPFTEHDRITVVERANDRCEYCHMVGWELQVDHISPRSRQHEATARHAGMSIDDVENLAAACGHCNRRKSASITGKDPLSGLESRLFNPRIDIWADHFAWSHDYQRVVPLTGVGGATIARLHMNDQVLQRQRALLRQAMLGGGLPWP